MKYTKINDVASEDDYWAMAWYASVPAARRFRALDFEETIQNWQALSQARYCMEIYTGR